MTLLSDNILYGKKKLKTLNCQFFYIYIVKNKYKLNIILNRKYLFFKIYIYINKYK